jgi:hypothetical protein
MRLKSTIKQNNNKINNNNKIDVITISCSVKTRPILDWFQDSSKEASGICLKKFLTAACCPKRDFYTPPPPKKR